MSLKVSRPHVLKAGILLIFLPSEEVLEVFGWQRGVGRLIFCVHLDMFLTFAQKSAREVT